jgi:hypothetical protein
MTHSADAPDRADSPPYSSLKLFILQRLFGAGFGAAGRLEPGQGQTFPQCKHDRAPLLPWGGEEKACR